MKWIYLSISKRCGLGWISNSAHTLLGVWLIIRVYTPMGSVAIQIHTKSVFNGNLTKSRLLVTSILAHESVWYSAQSTASLAYYVQNFKGIRQLRKKLWTKEILWDFPLRWISGSNFYRYQIFRGWIFYAQQMIIKHRINYCFAVRMYEKCPSIITNHAGNDYV